MIILVLAFLGQCLGQAGSSCAIVNRNMYIMGGLVNGEPSTKLINIDLTVPFEVRNFSLKSPQVSIFNLGSESYVPSYSTLFTTAANDSKLWTFGSLGGTPLGLRYFDLDRSQWEPSITLNQGPSSRSAFAWARYNNTQYLYGGSITTNNTLTNEFWQLSAGYMGSWKSLPIMQSAPAVQYQQSIVVNGRFIVLGGQLTDGTIRDLSEVWVFDLETSTWKTQATVGGKGFSIVKFTPLGTKLLSNH
ncbi:Negative regulator of mitotic exit [Entomophthora muscae]|uniref:Negative regulator of mitotic exit n=1 Tax=Entomophthora muscae TaxID=34485 RepID=A0ACC2RSL5_9FUNG|nr:Negative regulator of mitotic exit [Entomophthora muscae]